MKTKLYELKPFLILWVTQSFSALGSAMTNFALVIWLYERSGSATTTALLTVCSYAPYVVLSIFAGAVSDRWDKKKIMLVCDSFAALCTVCVLVLLCTDSLSVWHLYVLNAFNGLMNSIFDQRNQRCYEYSAAAGRRCGHDPADTKEILPEDKRNALIFQFACHYFNACPGNVSGCAFWIGGSHFL